MKFIKKNIIEITLVIIFSLSAISYLFLDFWNDEIYSFINFTNKGYVNIVSGDYNPNNHIILNLINHSIYIFSGHNSIHEVIQNPINYRLVSYVFGLITIISFFKLSNLCFNDNYSHVANAFFVLNIVFINFAFQQRGYLLSILFFILLIISILSSSKKKSFKSLILIVFFTTLSSYNLPSNIYFLLSILLWQFYELISKSSWIKLKLVYQTIEFKIIISIIAGLTLSLLLYFPIFDKVFFNPWVKPLDSSNFAYLSITQISVLKDFLNYSPFSYAVFIFGTILILIKIREHKDLVIMILSVALIPIVISLIRKDLPPQRVFVTTLPLFSIWLALGSKNLFEKFFKTYKKYSYLFIISMIFLFFTTSMIIKDIGLKNDINDGTTSQDLFFQYYLGNYKPMHDCYEFSKSYDPDLPVIVKTVDCWVAPYYLNIFNVNPVINNNIDSIVTKHGAAYLVTHKPHLEKFNDHIKVEIFKDNKTYHNFLKLTKK